MLLSSPLLSSQAKERRKRWMVEGEVDESNRVVGGCDRETGEFARGEGNASCTGKKVEKIVRWAACVCDEWEEGSEA